MEEARAAIPRLLKLFDESKKENVRIVTLEALIKLGAERKDLDPRLRPLAASRNDGRGKGLGQHAGREYSLAVIASRYLGENGDARSVRDFGVGGNQYHFIPADFAWGSPSAGLQVGVIVPLMAADFQKRYPEVERFVVAIRNVGKCPVVLPMNGSDPAGLELNVTESPSAHLALGWGPPELHELRPGQVLIRRPILARRLEFGQRNAFGRWISLVLKNRDYHVTVTLHGLGNPSPSHMTCYLSKAIRKECWQGEAKSGVAVTRLDRALQREMIHMP